MIQQTIDRWLSWDRTAQVLILLVLTSTALRMAWCRKRGMPVDSWGVFRVSATLLCGLALMVSCFVIAFWVVCWPYWWAPQRPLAVPIGVLAGILAMLASFGIQLGLPQRGLLWLPPRHAPPSRQPDPWPCPTCGQSHPVAILCHQSP